MKDPLLGNKIAGALLASLLLFFGLPQLADALFGAGNESGHEAKDGESSENPFPQYPVEYARQSSGNNAEAPAKPDLGTLLANANPAAGERRTAICKSCHDFTKGGPNKTGPNLWGVVGRPVASHEGFQYTPALKAFGGKWTYERLDQFLADSQTLVPGTGMNQHFPKPEQRADILAYLQTLSDNPVPFPKPAAKAPEENQSKADKEQGANGGKEGEAKAAEPTLGERIAEADPAAGENRAGICKACHSTAKGAADSIGPNLWGVVGRPVASRPGFNYTPALKAFGGNWTYQRLDAFLKDSAALVPGTAMAQRFAKPEQRAQLLAYLRTLSDNPVPLPGTADAASPENNDSSNGGDGSGAH